MNAVVIAQFVDIRVSDRKVADSRFDSWTGNASLCPWERQLPTGAKQYNVVLAKQA